MQYWCHFGRVGLGWVYSVGVVLGEGGAGMDVQCGGGVGGGWGWDGCTVWGWCWGRVGLGWVYSVGFVHAEIE